MASLLTKLAAVALLGKPALNLIKGLGGALVREKIVAAASKRRGASARVLAAPPVTKYSMPSTLEC